MQVYLVSILLIEIDDNPISRNRKNLRRLLSASDGRSGEMSWSRFTVSFNVFFRALFSSHNEMIIILCAYYFAAGTDGSGFPAAFH